MTEPILRIHDVHLSFGGVRALNGVEFDVPRGRDRRDHRAERRRQDHAVRLHLRLPQARPGRIVLSVDGAAWSSSRSAPRTNARPSASGRTFQNARLFKSMPIRDVLRTVQHDRMRNSGFFRSVLGFGGSRLDEAEAGKRADEVLELVGLAATPTSRRRNCPPACSACASWRRSSPFGPSCCCSTSRRRASRNVRPRRSRRCCAA